MVDEMLELLVRSRKFIIGAAIVLAVILLGVVGPFLTPDPLKTNYNEKAKPPNENHLLGTTDMGQDVLAQLCTGIRTSLLVGAIAGGIATLIAIIVGSIGPYIGGIADDASNALSNVVLVFPLLPLLLFLSKVIGERSLIVIATLIGLFTWPWAARSIRSQVLTLKEREFINLARMSGMKTGKIVIGEILPNMLAYIVMVFVISLSIGVLTEAGMSMIGVGPEPGTYVTMGSMLSLCMESSVSTARGLDLWWWYLPPGIIITIFLAGIFIMHAGMDEVFNPRLRRV
jgi:peptide/nickel transport system permease protein